MPRPTDPRTHITYQRQYHHCNSTRCKCYQADHPGHGPYWFNYYHALINGKHCLRTRYIGKRLPQDAPA